MEPEDTQVLVLNAAYQPIGTVSWRDAMIKLYAEKANERVEIVSTYKDKVARSAHAEHPLPCVVRHVKFRRQKANDLKPSRDNIWARDRGRCQYCGIQVPRSKYTQDHVFPKSRGGQKTWENIVVACSTCNGKKGDQTPAEAKMKLRTIPVKPQFLPDEFKSGWAYQKGMPAEWKPWFRADYWHGGTEESP